MILAITVLRISESSLVRGQGLLVAVEVVDSLALPRQFRRRQGV
jgi:hypothetical protein